MKEILILGTGFSSGALIDYLLKAAQANDWLVTVADLNIESARKAVAGHERGNAVQLDITDVQSRKSYFEKADLVVNLLPPALQFVIARACVKHRADMISASYVNKKTRTLDDDAKERGLLILNEMGLDPGIDHMSATALIESIRARGGRILSFVSYGSGVPAPEVQTNPVRYCITWNPHNVVRAGFSGAQYLEQGQVRMVPYHELFSRTWPVQVDGLGMMEAYPNRDSLSYIKVFDLQHIQTMIRATLRYPGWTEIWKQFARLGLANNAQPVPGLGEKSWREFTAMFLPGTADLSQLEQRVADYLDINPTGRIMDVLTWFGLFEDVKIGGQPQTAANAMTRLLRDKLRFPTGARDMVILKHEFGIAYGAGDQVSERIESTLIYHGDAGGFTAMSKTVGFPAAIAAELRLKGELSLSGCHIPTRVEIYRPVLAALERMGIEFTEKSVSLT